MSFLKKIFGFNTSINYKELIANGAQIVDVRTPGEFAGGYIKGSINLPLQNLPGQLNKLRKDKPVITCCASGIRSSNAKIILKSNGFNEVFNGGGWKSLSSKI